MAKLKLFMDNDNDFLLVGADISVLGWDVELKFRIVQQKSCRGRSQLPAPDILDLTENDYEEVVHTLDDQEDSA